VPRLAHLVRLTDGHNQVIRICMGAKMEEKLQLRASLFKEGRDPSTEDERRLLELFRLMQDTDRSSLLRDLSMRILVDLSKSAVPSSDFPVMLPREEDEAEPVKFAEEFLADIKPHREPAHNLGDELIPALNDAWNGSFAYDILGSAKYDEWRAVDLLSTLQAYAENAGRPVPPFGEDEIEAFILNWRSNFMDALERLKMSSERDRIPEDGGGRPNIDMKQAVPDDSGEKLRERLVALMPRESMVTDLWDWDIHFEETSFGDIKDAAFADDEELGQYAENLAEDFLQWIDEYAMDYNQEGWSSDEEFSEWIGERCLEFMRKWRANVRNELGR
jgi:hypothetical protein